MSKKPTCVDCGKIIGQRTPYDVDGPRRCVTCDIAYVRKLVTETKPTEEHDGINATDKVRTNDDDE